MQQKNGQSPNGFLFGLIVGVLLTLLFTTKKGRQILHTLTEEGMNKFSNVEDILHAMEEEDVYDDVDEVQANEFVNETEKETMEQHQAEEPTKKPAHPIKRLTDGHRFFRKPGRKI